MTWHALEHLASPWTEETCQQLLPTFDHNRHIGSLFACVS